MSGIFITKPDVALPNVAKMSQAGFDAYESNKTLALIKNTNHTFKAFEGLKFRTNFVAAGAGQINFNGQASFVPNVVGGAGTYDADTNTFTASATNTIVEEANSIYIHADGVNPFMTVTGTALSVVLEMLSRNLLSKFVWMNTGNWAHVKNGVTDTSGDTGADLTTSDGMTMSINPSGDLELQSNEIILYTFVMTWRATTTAPTGVMTSSAAIVGSWLPFTTGDTLDTVDAVLNNGSLIVESNFGQSNTYLVKLGSAVTAAGGVGEKAIETTNQSSFNYDTAPDFEDGVGNVTAIVKTGSLPSGVTLNSARELTGVPAAEGVYEFSIRSTDEMGNYADVGYVLTVTESINVSYAPPPATVGVPYSYPVPSNYNLVSVEGDLPDGLNFDNADIEGTPTMAGVYPFSVILSTGGTGLETVDVEMIVYAALAVNVDSSNEDLDNLALGAAQSGQSSNAKLSDTVSMNVSGGSGNFQFGITNGNYISSDGEITFLNTGETTVQVIDTVTGQIFYYTFNVAGQANVCGFAVVEETDAENLVAPCSSILTACDKSVMVNFAAMGVVKNIQAGQSPYREGVLFERAEGGQFVQSGKPFAKFTTSVGNGYAVAKNARDGKPFILTMAIDATVANINANNVYIGVAKHFVNPTAQGMDFAVAITTQSGQRYAELQQDGNYINGSRFLIAQGEEVGLGIFEGSVVLYINGLDKYTLSAEAFTCSGVDIVFIAGNENIVFGGKVTGLTYAIVTGGNPSDVGVIDSQTGEYTPSLENISNVVIHGTLPSNPNVVYSTNVRVISPAMIHSFENAMIEGIPVDIWVAEISRKDNLPPRLFDGRPDKNQFTNPEHLGTLQGAGKIDTTPARNDFTNDRGATSTSFRFDKAIWTGAFLNVRNQPLLQRLIPFMKQINSQGARGLRQYSTGCQKQMRLLMVWRNPSCDDVPVYDVIEIHNGKSYTPFTLEVGQTVQSNIPITIEGFPNNEGVIFDYWQLDKDYQVING